MTSSTSRIASLRSWFHECNFYSVFHLLKVYYRALHLRARSIPVIIRAIVEAVLSLQLPAWQSVQWLGYGLDDQGFDFRKGQEIFLFSRTPLLTLQPTPVSYSVVPTGSFPRSQAARTEADHLLSPSAWVKNQRSYTSTFRTCLQRVQRDNFTFTYLAVYLRLHKVWCMTINGS